MAGAGAKKRAEDNAKTVQLIGIYILVCAAVHAVVRLYVKGSSADFSTWAAFLGTMLVQGFCYISVVAVAKPAYQNGILIDGGGDLSKGLISYYFDVLYVTGFVQVLTSFTAYGWYLYAVVPLYAGYMIITKAIMPALQKDEQVEIDEATRKKLEKTERRAERRRIKRF